ncbi:hypothetical protein PR202_ga29886 [Eleusine coracana subsp. coracana]|uniref:CCR4-NOT transcription complex subunit 10 n=1 Tax=Eleusine coracana subsp. coracana TaxID=191504 RepID=A0AAV5DMW7_ELECO|nr:hypothetical protein PR202_ga29886 [Eleusine coracana subsp. coracana]
MEPPAAKEAPPPQSQPAAEEDGMLSATAAMARDAAVLFQSRRYAECAEVLEQLLLKKEGDPKVLHNMAITESFLDGCPDPKRLLKILGDVKPPKSPRLVNLAYLQHLELQVSDGRILRKRSEELECASREQADSANGVASNASAGSRGTGIVPTFSAVHNVSNYGCHPLSSPHYESALSVLDPLFRNIEPIDETTALHVCFLLLDITLALQDATKAVDIIQYLERSFGVANTANQNENASIAQQQSAQPKPPAKSNMPPDSDSNAYAGGCENLSAGSFSDDTLEFESFYSTLDGGHQNLGRPILNDLSRASDLAATAADLKRELKVLMNMARGRDSSTELLLKSQLEYAREKPLKLSALSQDKSCLISYNCGIQHLMCGKPLLAARCFREAMLLFHKRPLFWLRFSECSLLALEKGLLCAKGASSCIDEIEVNVVGSGKSRQLVISPMNSRINSVSGAVTSDESGNLISLGFARQCLLNGLLLLDASEKENLDPASFAEEDSSQGAGHAHKSSGQKSIANTDSKTPGPALVNANGEQKGTSLNATLQSSLALYDDLCRKENLKVRQAILGNLAFVELCLENPLKALSYAKLLQQLADCSRMYMFLSHVYAAEALCALNRPKDAAEQLSVYVRDGNDIELPYNVENCEKALVEKDSDGEDSITQAVTKLNSEELQHSESLKPEEARGVLYIDLGMTAAMQGELEQANYMVSRGLAMLPNNPRAVLASVYMDLLQGNALEAIMKLRQCRSVRFRPGSVAASR